MREGFWNNPQKISLVMLVGSSLLPAFIPFVNRVNIESYIGALFLLTLITLPFSLLFYVLGFFLWVFYLLQISDKGEHFKQTTKFGWLMSLLYNLAGVFLLISQIITFGSGNIMRRFDTLGNALGGALLVWLIIASVLSTAAFVARKPRYKWPT
jgi:hypothetical protein